MEDIKKEEVNLFPVLVKGRWGYIDRSGKVIIKPQFGFAGNFVEGLACVMHEEEWGYIDMSGRFVISPQFAFACDFHEGLAAVTPVGFVVYAPFKKDGSLISVIRHGQWGYINRSGNFVVNPNPHYYYAGDFSEGVAIVGDGYIDKSGRFFPFKKNYAKSYREPDVVIEGSGGNSYRIYKRPVIWGYVYGKSLPMLSVAHPRFNAPRFSEGLAPLMSGSIWGYIDKHGNFVISPSFRNAGNFSEGLARVNIGGLSQQYGVENSIHRSGRIFLTVGGKWGYIDKNRKFVINPRFDDAGDFSEGLAPVRAGDAQVGKWGYIDKSGNFAIKPQFDYAWEFSNGLAMVMVRGKIGYVEKTGKYIWKPRD